jgi:hypothetical protein
MGIALPLDSKPRTGGVTVHRIVGIESEDDCRGWMQYYESSDARGSVKINGHRFEFETLQEDDFLARLFMGWHGLERGPGVYVFTADGQLEYGMGSPTSLTQT